MRRSRMPKTYCSKFLARKHFSLENGKLKFNLENEGLKKRHYKTDPMLGPFKFPTLGPVYSVFFSS